MDFEFEKLTKKLHSKHLIRWNKLETTESDQNKQKWTYKHNE